MSKLQLNIKKTLLKRKINGVVTAENSDEEDETNTPPANPDENVLG